MKRSTAQERRRRDRDILQDLYVADRLAYHLDGWLTPIFCGGGDATHHSCTLRSLVKRGLVERKKRPRMGLSTGSRPSYLYRITIKGCAKIGEKPPTFLKVTR